MRQFMRYYVANDRAEGFQWRRVSGTRPQSDCGDRESLCYLGLYYLYQEQQSFLDTILLIN